MLIDFTSLRDQYASATSGKESKHSGSERLNPSIRRYDYLALSRLRMDVEILISALPEQKTPKFAIDLGSGNSPYRLLMERSGYRVKTFDTDADSGADFIGEIEQTQLPSGEVDLVLC